ncbi:RNA-directed DNA polymerase, eukaryota, reverse transcriptase zinc-binding domain protein [Tanacetum coccineum]
MVVRESSQPLVKDTTLTFQFPVLTSMNYTIWRMRMKVLLRIHEVWDVVDPGSGDAKKNNIVKGFECITPNKDVEVENRRNEENKDKNDMVNEELMNQEHVDNCIVSDEPAMSTGSSEKVKSSYSRILNNCLDNKLTLIPTKVGDDGVEVVIFDDEIVKEGSKKWELTVCGYFVGYKMSYQELSYNLYKMWGKFGLKHVMPNGNGVSYSSLKIRKVIQSVIENGPWMVNRKPMNLPLEAWNTRGISAIASRLGDSFDNGSMFGHRVENYGCRPKTMEVIEEANKEEERKKA